MNKDNIDKESHKEKVMAPYILQVMMPTVGYMPPFDCWHNIIQSPEAQWRLNHIQLSPTCSPSDQIQLRYELGRLALRW